MDRRETGTPMPDVPDDALITCRPPDGLRPRTNLARVIAGLDGARVRYRVAMPAHEKMLEGDGRFEVQMVNFTVCGRVLGEVCLPSAFEFGFHSFWLTHRGMVLLACGTAMMAEREPASPAGSFIQPVDWHGDAVIAARLWVEESRAAREQRPGTTTLSVPS